MDKPASREERFPVCKCINYTVLDSGRRRKAATAYTWRLQTGNSSRAHGPRLRATNYSHWHYYFYLCKLEQVFVRAAGSVQYCLHSVTSL
jgi:hypothetical protein